jgi:aryl-alcohol dehydrogenase-like predicted oxidoreductase
LEYKNLGKSDLKVSAVGLGTGFRGGITQNSHKVIEAALDLGVTLIDTAEIYEDGQSEKLVGQVIKDKRDEVVLVTKVSGDHI